MSSSESAVRERCSQGDHAVTGCDGSLHPMGQPMIQSEKAGLKARLPGKCRVPSRKVKWSGGEQGDGGAVGLRPVACDSSQSVVHHFAISLSPTCEPAWSVRVRLTTPLAENRISG